MERIDHRLTLDVTRPGSQGRLYVRAGDADAHRLYVILRMGAEKFTLSPDMSIKARARNETGVVSEYDCSTSEGAAVWDIPSAAIDMSGTLECELYVASSGGAHFATPRFDVIVDDAIGGGVG